MSLWGRSVVAAAAIIACLCCCASALAVGDANIPSCSHETEASPGFRTWLPDCRAYELVSPAYGAGAVTQNVSNFPPLALGDQVLAQSFGDFAEAEELGQVGTEFGEVYQFSRTSSGWSAEPQNPPASLYPFRVLEDVGSGQLSRPAELDRSVWLVPQSLPAGEEREQAWLRKNNSQYVLREGRGAFVTVGPAVAPGHVTSSRPSFSFVDGVSSDAAKIVFSVVARNKQLWPGDGTEEREGGETFGAPSKSLYEYSQRGAEPVLVGVKNDGAPPWQPGAVHVNEGAQLESDCGIGYDAMSANGETVFFTALNEELNEHGEPLCTASQPAVNELYARVSGAHTVAISEPSMSIPGRECTGTCREDEEDPAKRSPATFQGASEDGAEIFFTSKQPLVNTATAGGLYLYEETLTGEGSEARVGSLTLIAADVTPLVEAEQPNHAAEYARVAPSGSRVYFESTQEWHGKANGNGEMPANGAPNLYVYDTEGSPKASFVASYEGTEPFQSGRPNQKQSLDTTADGQFLVFASEKHLDGTGDSSAAAQLFEYDAQTTRLVRVSIGQRSPAGYECEATHTLQEGYDCEGNTNDGENDTPRIVPFPGKSIAADGTVVFTSELPLTPLAVQGRPVFAPSGEVVAYAENLYEYRDGQVYLISPGNEATPVPYLAPREEVMRLFGIDESGQDVFFSTVDSLVTQDTDTQSSWYDAREEGGFPAPPGSSECGGEACQGSVPGAPALPAAGGSALTPGEGALAPASTGKSTPKTAAQLRAEKLAKALKGCRKLRKHTKRVGCERQARKRYGPSKAHKARSSARDAGAGAGRRAGR